MAACTPCSVLYLYIFSTGSRDYAWRSPSGDGSTGPDTHCKPMHLRAQRPQVLRSEEFRITQKMLELWERFQQHGSWYNIPAVLLGGQPSAETQTPYLAQRREETTFPGGIDVEHLTPNSSNAHTQGLQKAAGKLDTFTEIYREEKEQGQECKLRAEQYAPVQFGSFLSTRRRGEHHQLNQKPPKGRF